MSNAQATEFTEQGLPGIATGTLVGNRFGRIVGTTDREIDYAEAGESPVGIIGADAATGEVTTLHLSGVGPLRVNGLSTPIARGDYLKPTTSGIGIKASSTDTAGAIALEAADEDGVDIDVAIIGPTVVAATPTTYSRSQLAQDDLQPYAIPMEQARIHDNIVANLGATAISADDLILTAGTFGTDAVKITATDFGGTSATQYARFRVPVPVEYVAGQTINLRINAGMVTTVADTSCFLDVECFRMAAPSTDICATAQQSMNSLSAANLDFVLTPTNVVPGDILDIRVKIAGVDGGNAGVITPTINSITLLADIKG